MAAKVLSKTEEIKKSVINLLGTRPQFVTFDKIEEEGNGFRAEITYLKYRYVVIGDGDNIKLYRKVA